MTEADFQSKFTTWKKYYLKGNAAYELKISKKNSIAFNRLEQHQRVALLSVKHDQFCYKIPDVGYDKKPFDMFCLSGEAYVVVMFYVTRGTKLFYVIDIDDWCAEEESSTRKSLTIERAEVIGRRYLLA
jgi:hypothetical protein